MFLRKLRAGRNPGIERWLVGQPNQAPDLRLVLEGAVLFAQEFRSFRRRYPGLSLCRMFGIRRRSSVRK